MSTHTEYLNAHVTIAPEGDIVVLDTTTAATSFDLLDTDLLGLAVQEGKPWYIFSTVDTWIKFASTAGTAIDKTARSVASAGGGAAQGGFLPARTYIKHFFDKPADNPTRTVLHVQNDTASGVIIVMRAGQDTH